MTTLPQFLNWPAIRIPGCLLWWYLNIRLVHTLARGLPERFMMVKQTKLRNAWVTKLEGPTLNATANEVAIETVELAHEGLTIEHR